MHTEYKGDIKFGVITVSSTRKEEDDLSGKYLKSSLETVTYYKIVKDDIKEIRRALLDAMEAADVIILCGGTGISRLDLTFEAVNPFIEKHIAGFSTAMFMESFKNVGLAAMLSRSIAGIHGNRVIFCIPGSINAAMTASEIIKKEIRHILGEVYKETSCLH